MKKGMQDSVFQENYNLMRRHKTRKWSGRPDLNRRPLHPQCSALPDCATPRKDQYMGIERGAHHTESTQQFKKMNQLFSATSRASNSLTV